jgi:hypothetical protein
MGLSGVVILDALCSVELGVVSWAIVVTPFIMVALASSISLGLGLDRMLARNMRDGFEVPVLTDGTLQANPLSTRSYDSLPEPSNIIT